MYLRLFVCCLVCVCVHILYFLFFDICCYHDLISLQGLIKKFLILTLWFETPLSHCWLLLSIKDKGCYMTDQMRTRPTRCRALIIGENGAFKPLQNYDRWWQCGVYCRLRHADFPQKPLSFLNLLPVLWCTKMMIHYRLLKAGTSGKNYRVFDSMLPGFNCFSFLFKRILIIKSLSLCTLFI